MNFEISLDEIIHTAIGQCMLEKADTPQEALQTVLCALSTGFLYAFSTISGLKRESEIELWEMLSDGVIKYINQRHDEVAEHE